MRYIPIALLLAACGSVPEGNINPEVFRAEYDATSAVVVPTHALHEIVFIVMSFDALQVACPYRDRKCAGWAKNWSTGVLWEDPVPVVALTHPPDDHCDRLEGANNVYADVVNHELLHVFGFDHGEQMDLAQAEAWEIYREAHCF